MGSKRLRGSGGSALLQKRLAQIRACDESGATLKAYAARHRISVHALYQAKKQARQQGLLPAHGTKKTVPARPSRSRQARFVEAITPSPSPAPGCTWRLRLRSGDVLESSTPLTAQETLRLLDALRGHP